MMEERKQLMEHEILKEKKKHEVSYHNCQDQDQLSVIY